MHMTYITKHEEGEKEALAIDREIVDIDTNSKSTMSLSSIESEDLRDALASFDIDGSGTIDLNTILQAAEGKTRPKLHWSENRPVGLSDIRLASLTLS